MEDNNMINIALLDDNFLNITSFIETIKFKMDNFHFDIMNIKELYNYSLENECIIPHMMLEKYGVLTIVNNTTKKENTDTVKRLLIKQLQLIENKDFTVTKTKYKLPSGTKYKNQYFLSPDAFKLCPIRSQKNNEYAKHFIKIERLFMMYYKYQCEYDKLQYKKEIEKLKNMEHIKKYSREKAVERLENKLEENNKFECIYFIQEDDSDVYKVGFTGNLKERLMTLQIGNSRKLSVYKTILCQSALDYEQNIHKKIIKYHVNGEWYKLSGKIIDNIILYIN